MLKQEKTIVNKINDIDIVFISFGNHYYIVHQSQIQLKQLTSNFNKRQ